MGARAVDCRKAVVVSEKGVCAYVAFVESRIFAWEVRYVSESSWGDPVLPDGRMLGAVGSVLDRQADCCDLLGGRIWCSKNSGKGSLKLPLPVEITTLLLWLS